MNPPITQTKILEHIKRTLSYAHKKTQAGGFIELQALVTGISYRHTLASVAFFDSRSNAF